MILDFRQLKIQRLYRSTKKSYAFRNDVAIREREAPTLRTTLVCLRPMTLRPHEDAMHRNAMQRDATQARG